MKKLIVSALLAASLFSAPGAVSVATAANAAAVCGPDAPAALRRPGGYCEQINGGQSLSTPVEETCWWWLEASLPQTLGARIHVAEAVSCPEL